MTHFLIIGGGISGLVCAQEIQTSSNEHTITIFEKNAEIGYPQTRPGLIENQELLKEYSSFKQMGTSGCRRPWAAKSISQQLTANGVNIHVRTRVQSLNPLTFHGAGPPFIDSYDLVIDATNNQFPSEDSIISQSRGEISEFVGGVALGGGRFVTPEILAIRSDNTVECWYREKLPPIVGGWLEIMHGSFNTEEASIDSSFERGKSLAEAALTSI
jgi:hypothetical protein